MGCIQAKFDDYDGDPPFHGGVQCGSEAEVVEGYNFGWNPTRLRLNADVSSTTGCTMGEAQTRPCIIEPMTAEARCPPDGAREAEEFGC